MTCCTGCKSEGSTVIIAHTTWGKVTNTVQWTKTRNCVTKCLCVVSWNNNHHQHNHKKQSKVGGLEEVCYSRGWMCLRNTRHSVGGMERGVYWHQNEEQRDKRERKQVKMKGEKGMRMKCGFFRTETFRHSQSIWTNPPILVCDGMEEKKHEIPGNKDAKPHLSS